MSNFKKSIFYTLFILTIFTIFQLISASSPVIPSGVSYYIPINIINTQSSAVSANTPIAIGTSSTGSIIGFNALPYSSYFTQNNFEFFYANGTIIPSWLEAWNTSNEISSSLSSNMLEWINLGANTPNELPASMTSNYIIYMGFAGNVVSSSNTLFNNVNTGEAPQLSPSYAEYDDGANVFDNYWNFAGTALPTGWTIGSGVTVSANNGLTLSTNNNGNSYIYNTELITPYIIETYAEETILYSSLAASGIGTASSTTAGWNWATAIWDNGGVAGGFDNQVGGTWQTSSGTGTSANNVFYVLGMYVASGGNTYLANYGNLFSTTSGTTQGNGYLALAQGDTGIYQWLRTRAYPPNGVMPTTTLGTIQTAVPLSVSITPTSATYDTGQSVSLTATASGGTSPYTYQWYNDTTGTATAITGQTSSTLTATAGTVAETAKYYVEVTDSASSTATSSTGSYVINTELLAGSITPSSPTIDSGQSITLTANPSGGTTPYSYQWYSGTSSTCSSDSAISGATSSTYSASPTSNTYYCYIVEDSATTKTTATSGTDLITVNTALGTPSITSSNSTIDNGQKITITSSWTGGTPDYTAKLYSSSTSTCNTGSTLTQTLSSLTSGSASFTGLSPSSTTYYCIFVTDSATTPETTNSINNEVIVNSALGIPTLSSSPSLPSTQNAGNTIVFTASWSGGTPDYTANYLITNTITNDIVANMLYSGITTTSNTFSWTIPNSLVANTLTANVIITDSATTSEIKNSTKTGTLTVDSVYSLLKNVQISPLNIKLDYGQTILISSNWFGGLSPYKATLYSSNSQTCNSNSNLVQTISDISSNSITFSLLTPTTTTYYCVNISDSSYPIQTNNSQTDKVIVNNELNNLILTSIPSLSNTLDANEIIIFNATWTGGTPAFSANFIISNSITNNIITSNSITAITKNYTSFSYKIPESDIGNTIEANVIIIDNATTQENVVSNYLKTLTINQPLSNPTISSNPALSQTMDVGTNITFTAGISYGTSPYTYNFILSNYTTNSILLTKINTNSLTTNSFKLEIPSNIQNNSIKANVIISDNTYNSTKINSTYIYKLNVNPELTLKSYTQKYNQMVANQIQIFTAEINGGTSPYTYNFLVFNSIGNLVGNYLTTTNNKIETYSFSIPNNVIGEYTSNIIINDSAYYPEQTKSTSTFFVVNNSNSYSVLTGNLILESGIVYNLKNDSNNNITIPNNENFNIEYYYNTNNQYTANVYIFSYNNNTKEFLNGTKLSNGVIKPEFSLIGTSSKYITYKLNKGKYLIIFNTTLQLANQTMEIFINQTHNYSAGINSGSSGGVPVVNVITNNRTINNTKVINNTEITISEITKSHTVLSYLELDIYNFEEYLLKNNLVKIAIANKFYTIMIILLLFILLSIVFLYKSLKNKKIEK